MTRRTGYRSRVIRDGADIYEAHLGRPGKPNIYLRTNAGLRRVTDEATLDHIAVVYAKQVTATRAAIKAEDKRKRGLLYRIMAWLGRKWAIITAWVKRPWKR